MVTQELTNRSSGFKDASGKPLSGMKIKFTLCTVEGSPTDAFDSITQEWIAPGPVFATTDDQGEFAVQLWPNDRGYAPSRYLCEIPIPGMPSFVGNLVEKTTAVKFIEFRTGAEWPEVGTLSGDGGQFGDTPTNTLDGGDFDNSPTNTYDGGTF